MLNIFYGESRELAERIEVDVRDVAAAWPSDEGKMREHHHIDGLYDRLSVRYVRVEPVTREARTYTWRNGSKRRRLRLQQVL